MPEFFFPATFLIPEFEETELECAGFKAVRRRWGVSLFDWATLSTKHKVHFDYRLGDVVLGGCNSEFALQAASIDEAVKRLELLRFGLAVVGVSPFVCPFASTHSVNSYSAINDRESEYLRTKLDDERSAGPTSPETIIEMWPVQLTLACVVNREYAALSAKTFLEAATVADRWDSVARASSQSRSFMQAMLAAPTVMPITQSYLHMWTGLESLFPDINAELTFRLSILLAQLAESGAARRLFYKRVKEAYAIRSKITHGNRDDVTPVEWRGAWDISRAVAHGILSRGAMPTEAALMADVFS